MKPPILPGHSFLDFTVASCNRREFAFAACGSVRKKEPRREESTEWANQGFNQIRRENLRKRRFRTVREDDNKKKRSSCLHSSNRGDVRKTTPRGCYLSFTSLSWAGSRGLRFIMSDSERSYASEIAGTYKTGREEHKGRFSLPLECNHPTDT